MRSLLQAIVVAALVVVAVTVTLADTSADTPLTVDVVVHADTGLGEPQIAVDPTDPDTIVVGENDTGVSVSHDRGLTWSQVSLPNQGDNALTVLPDGRFLYTSLNGAVHASDDTESWSEDGNWVGVGAETLEPLPGSDSLPLREVACNLPGGAGPVELDPTGGPGVHIIGCDRPWMAADPITGTAYISFTDHADRSGGFPDAEATEFARYGEFAEFVACKMNIGTHPTMDCGRQYVRSSTDGGRTWGPFHPLDSADYPAGQTGGWSSGTVAADGVLATGYIASRALDSDCAPCLVFGTSTDDGVSWERHLVPAEIDPDAIGSRGNLNPVGVNPSVVLQPYVAADPSRAGRFALMVFDAAQEHLLVFVSEDSGETWSGPATLGEPGGGQRWLPWLAYGPTGALGAMWRTTDADDGYTVWAAVAPAGGTAFADPVKLSSERSPGPVFQVAGDDASDVAVDATALHAVWGDRRSGTLSIHYGRYDFARDPAVQALTPNDGSADLPVTGAKTLPALGLLAGGLWWLAVARRPVRSVSRRNSC